MIYKKFIKIKAHKIFIYIYISPIISHIIFQAKRYILMSFAFRPQVISNKTKLLLTPSFLFPFSKKKKKNNVILIFRCDCKTTNLIKKIKIFKI
jgi:hypothetical protein